MEFASVSCLQSKPAVCSIGLLGGSLLFAVEGIQRGSAVNIGLSLASACVSVLSYKKQSCKLSFIGFAVLTAKFLYDCADQGPKNGSEVGQEALEWCQADQGPKNRGEVGRETLEWCQNGRFTRGEVLFERSTSREYPIVAAGQPGNVGVDVVVKEQDCIEALQEERAVPDARCMLVLFASTDEFGGGFRDMNVGQEESICRRSEMAGLMDHLGSVVQLEDPEKVNLNHHFLYTPDVRFFRASEGNGFAEIEPFSADVLASAAIHKPEIRRDNGGVCHYDDEEQIAVMRNRIYHHIRYADENRCSTLVTGAFGCGAFQNPPHEVAALYREAMENTDCQFLKKVVFAILPDRNGSLEAFQEAFNNLEAI